MGDTSEVELGWGVIETELPQGFRELAREMGLIRPLPPHLGAKITDISDILRLVFQYVGLEMSLRITTATTAAAGGVTLSSVALHKWMRKLGPYLATLLAQKLGAAATFASPRWAGYEVIAADGTTITRPGSTGTDARVHYALRLADFALVHCRATEPSEGETLRVFTARPGQLWLVDRCYSNPPGIAALADQGAEVIVRHNRGALPLFDAQGRVFDVLAHLRSITTPEGVAEWSVRVRPEGHAPLAGRLCAVRLSEAKAEQARKRLRREYGTDVSAQALEATAWLVVFTTVPRTRLSAQRVLALYRLRWQVELEIKRDKSIGGVDHLPVFREDTIATWLYAKLLLQEITRALVVSATEIFPPDEDATAPASARRPEGAHGGRVLARPRAA